MKPTANLGALLLGSVLAGSTWSHHAAQGIVSDEIWQMIDTNLQEADSPHLYIDFTDIMGSMSVIEGDNGDLYLMSSALAYVLEAQDYDLALAEAEALAAQALTEANKIPSGNTNSGDAATAWFTIVELDNYVLEIQLFEPLGFGNSQTGEDPGRRR